jgi:hypothetical protein
MVSTSLPTPTSPPKGHPIRSRALALAVLPASQSTRWRPTHARMMDWIQVPMFAA